MDIKSLAPHAHQVLEEAFLPELPNYYRGKVRDNYDLPGGKRVLITTDRISAFDRTLGAIPFKGQVLNKVARFWFDETAGICPNHVLDIPDPNVIVGQHLKILPVEVVVRGYLAGTTSTSILTRYKAGEREMYGHRFGESMRANEPLPQPIITPTTKADAGGHDEPLSEAQILEQGLLGEDQWHTVSKAALALFARGQEVAARRGLILADTKYEFGMDADGRILLADEIHTPDSSRYWFAESYRQRFEAGAAPESFDKDFVRNWVVARCDPYRDPIPALPQEVVLEAAAVYIRASEIITGTAFDLPDVAEVPLERIRQNVSDYF